MLVKVTFAMLLVYLASMTPGRAADEYPADTDFVGKAEQSSSQEMADSKEALAKSKDPAILAVAKSIQKDGAAANQQLGSLAVEKGWPAPTLDSPNAMSHYSDHRFVVRQIKAYLDALAFYGQEAANGADTSLQEFARRKTPIFRHRLASLRSLRNS